MYILIILKIIDYDKDCYVIEAVESLDAPNYNSPYYAILKESGKVTSFVPTLDLDAFFEAMENRTLFSRY